MEITSLEILWLNEWTANNSITKPLLTEKFYYFDLQSKHSIKILPIEKFILPKRSDNIKFFDENRLQRIFYAIDNRYPLPPVECTTQESGKFFLRDGFHRFYTSKWCGYSHIPAILDSWFTFEV